MKIYIIFSMTYTWLSRIIQLASKDKYPHASIAFERNCEKMYSMGRINPSNPFSGGFVIESFREGLYKKRGDAKCLIFEITVDHNTLLCLKKMLNEFIQKRHLLKYNVLGLVLLPHKIAIQRSHFYFCTQFVATLLIGAKIIHTETPPALMTSAEIIKLLPGTAIYEGTVQEFIQHHVD